MALPPLRDNHHCLVSFHPCLINITQLNYLIAANCHACVPPPWAQRLRCTAPLGSEQLIHLSTKITRREKPRMLHLHICVRVTSTQIRASNISLMFTAAKSHFSLIYAAVYTCRHNFTLNLLKTLLTCYILWISACHQPFKGKDELFVSLLLLLIGRVLHNKQPRQVKN